MPDKTAVALTIAGSDSGGGGGSGYTNGSVNMLFGGQGGNTNALSQCLVELLTSDNQKWVNIARGV